ncbi:MAG: chromate transporter [Lachnospiraceae bacterium]|nr:chromate transporter [Lachnospiraceae bacterium]
MIYLQLFFSFLQVGAFSFGGGYAAMPLIQEQVINHYGWLSVNEFTNLITISEMTPGPIAVNSATFVGLKIAGIGGAVCATLGCILPSCILVSIMAHIYLKYRKMTGLQGILHSLRPAVVSMIAVAGLTILTSAFWRGADISLSNTQWDSVLIFMLALYLLKRKHADAILVMLGSGVMKIIFTLILNIL